MGLRVEDQWVAPEKISGELVIYFITTNQPGFPVKIGKSNTFSLPRRISQLQTALPFAIKFLYVGETDLKTEKSVHEALGRHHMRGEWFTRTETVEQWIKTLVKEDPKWRERFGLQPYQTIVL